MRLRKLFSRTDGPEGEWRMSRHRHDNGGVVARGRVTLFISHGAGSVPYEADDLPMAHGFVDWFIVEPRANPERQVEDLRKAGRTVIEIAADPWNGERDA